MFFSNLLILGGGLLMATTGVEARAIGKLSFLRKCMFLFPRKLSSFQTVLLLKLYCVISRVLLFQVEGYRFCVFA